MVQQEGITCTRAVYMSPDNDPLRPHIPFRADDATLQQETDAALASDEEIAAILAVHPRLQACRKAILDKIVTFAPTFIPALAAEMSAGENSIIDLIQKRQSWGEHVQRVKKAEESARAELIVEGRRIDDRLARSNDAELARRQAAFNALAQYNQNQQLIDAATRPTTQSATCTQFGNTVNCVGTSR
jgi:hypothetical protein